MKNVIITGRDSLLASYIYTPRYSDLGFINCSHDTLDITSFKSIVNAIEDHRMKPGDVILNCAAFTDVRKAESSESKDMLEAVNIVGPRNLAEACNHYGLKLIHISTDYVYDGDQSTIKSDKGYSHSTDFLNERPLNNYGASKLQGEREIASVLDDFLIIRTAGLYGENRRKMTFLHRILKQILIKNVEEVDVFSDCHCSFTYAKDLAKWIVSWLMLDDDVKKSIRYEFGRIVNVVNVPENPFLDTIYSFTGKFLEEMNLNEFSYKLNRIPFPVNVICRDGIRRPKDVTLRNEIDSSEKFQKILKFKMPSTEHAIKDFCLNNYRGLIDKAKLAIAIDNGNILDMRDKFEIEDID
jgi:dTDP-4-dehydrorhamnose reductase